MPKSTYGTYTKLDINSVKSSSDKTIAFLKNKLPQLASHTVNVIFLGEEHRNNIDEAVTTSILLNPPVLIANETRVILERGLAYAAAQGMDMRQEAFEANLSRLERSAKIAFMIQDAFDEHDKKLVYVACGSAHAEEIFNALNKTMKTNFGFIAKLSSTD